MTSLSVRSVSGSLLGTSKTIINYGQEFRQEMSLRGQSVRDWLSPEVTPGSPARGPTGRPGRLIRESVPGVRPGESVPGFRPGDVTRERGPGACPGIQSGAEHPSPNVRVHPSYTFATFPLRVGRHLHTRSASRQVDRVLHVRLGSRGWCTWGVSRVIKSRRRSPPFRMITRVRAQHNSRCLIEE